MPNKDVYSSSIMITSQLPELCIDHTVQNARRKNWSGFRHCPRVVLSLEQGLKILFSMWTCTDATSSSNATLNCYAFWYSYMHYTIA